MPGRPRLEIAALLSLWRPGDDVSLPAREGMGWDFIGAQRHKRMASFLGACMVGLASLILAGSCAPAPSPSALPPTQTEKPPTIVPPSRTPTTRPTGTATNTPLPFEAVMPEGAHLIAPEDSILRFEFNQAALEREGEYLLVFGKEPYPSLPPGGEITLDILDWTGQREPLLRVSYEGRKEGLHLGVVPQGDLPSSVALLKLVESFDSNELYVVDIENRRIWGLQHGCEQFMLDEAISDKYLAYSCFEENGELYFLPLDAPDQPFMRSLAGATEDPLASSLISIIGNLAIFYPDASYQACAGEIHDWRPACKELPFWLGPLSPDGKWFEVRTENESAPYEIGIMGPKCLLKQNVGCTPRFTTAPPDMASFNRRLGHSAWDPLSEAIFYIVHIDTVRTNNEPEESEFWRYDLMTQRFEKLFGPLPGVFHFGELWYMYQPSAPWSPDGRYVAMKEIGGGIYKLEVETGELSLLSEGGMLLGSVHLE